MEVILFDQAQADPEGTRKSHEEVSQVPTASIPAIVPSLSHPHLCPHGELPGVS